MVMMGDVVTMECKMDTQGTKVMWMKWMKDGQEILMMEPDKAPVAKDVEGVTLDVSTLQHSQLLSHFTIWLWSMKGSTFILN